MSTSTALKEQVFQHFRQVMAAKIDLLQKGLKDLSDSAANETKSSAGDKFETGRAMLHIEQDNVRRQLAEAMAQHAILDMIDPAVHSEYIVLGSLVEISGDFFYLSTALGKVVIGGMKIMSLSAQSPLGAQLMHRKTGDKVSINSVERIITGFI